MNEGTAKRLLTALVGAVAMSTMTANAQAAEFTGGHMNISFGPDGTITALFGNSSIAGNRFNDMRLFGVTGAINEELLTQNLPVPAGVLNGFNVSELPRVNQSYEGQVASVPSSAVPEPATWAFLILGFGTVGYSLRRRQTGKHAQAV